MIKRGIDILNGFNSDLSRVLTSSELSKLSVSKESSLVICSEFFIRASALSKSFKETYISPDNENNEESASEE